ncbi:MAG: amino acid ABC transporter permease [Deltaproteobacteria bacterium]|nr:amino acid ABC transporter permease [Deltaproteobacteria bacterium]MBW1912782.1 amino acid ABC transporter permease [Deltaproteobacteria bacterium]
MDYDFSFNIVLQFLPDLLLGLRNTVLIGLIGILCATAFGVIVALARLSRFRSLSMSAAGYVALIRATPLLIQIYFLFYGLPEFGILLSPFVVAVLALTLNSGAYASEIIRAGIENIHKTQYEAADSLAMTYQQKMMYVILPQAFRNIFPPLVGQASYLVKDSAIVSVMGTLDLTKSATTFQAVTFRPLEAFLPTMVLYLFLILTLIYGSSFLDKRLRKW